MSIDRPMLLHLPLPIRTPRLIITPPHPNHAEKIHQAILESMDNLQPWMVWTKKPMTLEERTELMVQKQAKFILREDLMFLAFTHEGEFVLATGFHDIEWDIGVAEIGYWCKTSATDNGYMTEAVNALIRYAFDIMKMRKVEIGMDSENIRSERVAQRLNMVKEFERVGGIKTLHQGGLRTRYGYCCFGTDALPPLKVAWD